MVNLYGLDGLSFSSWLANRLISAALHCANSDVGLNDLLTNLLLTDTKLLFTKNSIDILIT